MVSVETLLRVLFGLKVAVVPAGNPRSSRSFTMRRLSRRLVPAGAYREIGEWRRMRTLNVAAAPGSTVRERGLTRIGTGRV
jgi:hypothetical protein